MIIVEVRIRWHPGTGKARLFSIRRVNNTLTEIPWKKATKETIPEFVEQALAVEWDEHPYPRVFPGVTDPKALYGLFRENNILISPDNGVYVKVRSDGQHFRGSSLKTQSHAFVDQSRLVAEHNYSQPSLL